MDSRLEIYDDGTMAVISDMPAQTVEIRGGNQQVIEIKPIKNDKAVEIFQADIKDLEYTGDEYIVKLKEKDDIIEETLDTGIEPVS